MNQNEENLLREFVRRTIIPHVTADLKQEHVEEQKARRWARNLIKESREKSILESLFEAKDMANPHPNTGINKLRDAIRKAKPSIKSKYQQLTTDAEQRESFTNHFLGAMVRLFDELDALSAQGEEALDVASEFDSVNLGSDIEAPPTDLSSDDLADDIEGELGITESILREVDIDIEDDAVSGDIVSDEFKDEEESEKIKNKSQAEKDFDKKNEDETKRKDFGDGLEGDATGRNQAFDAFNLVQSYFSDAYLDLNNPNDMEMFKKWCLYNVKLLLDKYETELESNPQAPEIQNPT
jgi:hypothetical protein